MKCLICGEDEMISSVTTYFAQVEECYVIIENVPCKECRQCGETVFSMDVLERIDDILEKVKLVASKVMIMDYGKAA